MIDTRRRTGQRHSVEEKIRDVLEGRRGEDHSAGLRRRAGIAMSLCWNWPRESLEARKARRAGDAAHRATSPGVRQPRQATAAPKAAAADLNLVNRPGKERLPGLCRRTRRPEHR